MYAGPKAFSEKESQVLAKLLTENKDAVIAYVSLHTYGQKWMTPFGHSKEKPTNLKEMVSTEKELLHQQARMNF